MYRKYCSILLHDESAPFVRVKSLCVFTQPPQVDASGCSCVLGEKTMLANEPRYFSVFGRHARKDFPGFVSGCRLGKLELNKCRDHDSVPLVRHFRYGQLFLPL